MTPDAAAAAGTSTTDTPTAANVWVVLVNYRGMADTVECLASIRADLPGTRVVVVENGSGDGSAAVIRAAHPWAEVIETGQNLGFTGGNNIGIRWALEAGADWVWLLNNDTTVGPGAIRELLRVAEADDRWGILTPRIDYYDHPGEPWFAGSRIDLSRGEAVHDNSHPADPAAAPAELPWLTGCAMFCRRSVLEQTGGFDDRFYLNWEDVDLSLRAKRLGWNIGIVPAARIRHKVSRARRRTIGRDVYYSTRNRLLVVWSHSGDGRRLRNTTLTAYRSLYAAIRWVLKWEPNCVAVLWGTNRGMLHFARGRFGKL